MLYTITFSKNHPYEEQASKTFELFRISGDINSRGDWVWFRNDDHGTWWGWDSPRMGAITRVMACGKEDTPNLGQLHEMYRVEEVGEVEKPTAWENLKVQLELGRPELGEVEEREFEWPELEEDDPDEE